MNCSHKWKLYTGLTGLNTFDYCEDCGIKKSDVKDERMGIHRKGHTFSEASDYLNTAVAGFNSWVPTPTATHNNNRWAPYQDISEYIMVGVASYRLSKSSDPKHIFLSPRDSIELFNSHFPLLWGGSIDSARRTLDGISVVVDSYVANPVLL